ncbi:hypothetical protein [Pseudovibrio sp. Ad46]|uniref:hypothetical protein n=1 Tax=Pseudovibrio sp. Ad46 TaxID=989432 RepID=UPI0007AE6536|nr:hypothetical protein [Pseudovibrio sp. Ad46]
MSSDNDEFFRALKTANVLVNNSTILQTSTPALSTFANKIRYLEWSLKKSEPKLFSDPEVRYLKNGLDKLDVLTNSYQANPQAVSQTDFDNAINELLIKFTPPRNINIEYDNVGEVIESVRDSSKLIIDDLSAQVTAERSHLAKLRSSQREVEKKVDELNALLSEQKGRITSLSDNYNKEFNAELEQFRAKHGVQRDDFEVQFQKITNGIELSNAKLVQQRSNDLDDELTEILGECETARMKSQGLVKEINDLYGIAGSNVMSGDLLKQAGEERTTYIWYSRIAMFFYLAAPSILFYLLAIKNGIQTDNLEALLKRAPLAAVFLIPAWYISGLAQKHRRVEVALRSLGLRLAAFEPYLAHFDTEEKNELKRQMADKFFDAQISTETTKSLNSKEISNYLDSVVGPMEKIIDVVKKNTGAK